MQSHYLLTSLTFRELHTHVNWSCCVVVCPSLHSQQAARDAISRFLTYGMICHIIALAIIGNFVQRPVIGQGIWCSVTFSRQLRCLHTFNAFMHEYLPAINRQVLWYLK